MGLFTAFYVGAGVMHFINPEFYLRIMPPYFPMPAFWVYLTGVLEIAVGILIWVPKTRKYASLFTVAMLIAFLPVHIFMVTNAEQFADMGPKIALWIRFPIQGVLILWAWWLGRK